MTDRNLLSDGLLLLTAVIWGFAFVAQRVGMAYIGPFTFNGLRFALGCLVLLPFVVPRRSRPRAVRNTPSPMKTAALPAVGALCGTVLFAGASLQQVGLVYTTAGNAGFITGLYVVIVPIMGLLWGQRTHRGTWLGALLAVAGLYLLSVTEQLHMAIGDFLVLLGAFAWAAHVHIIGRWSSRTDPVRLAWLQFAICSLLSLITGFILETIRWTAIWQAAFPLLYGGALSVGVAYTLQVVAQRRAHPAHAAILLSLESAFAALGGWLLLGEVLPARGIVGCVLMLVGMLVSQLSFLAVSTRRHNLSADTERNPALAKEDTARPH